MPIWVGTKRVAVIPAIVSGDQRFQPPPANWEELINQRLFYDPDPSTGFDRSLRNYIFAISYGRARLEADILPRVQIGPCDLGGAIIASRAAANYEAAAVIFTANTACNGYAEYGVPFPYFSPPVPNNQLVGWCRVSMSDRLGVWAMELLHAITWQGDLYNRPGGDSPGRFDEMDCACASHPSAYLKLNWGWLDLQSAPAVTAGSPAEFTLHTLGLLQPPPPARVTACRIAGDRPNHFFHVEARGPVDSYDGPSPVSPGVPSAGVVVYEIDESLGPPVGLRTASALTAGQVYSNAAARFEVIVDNAVAGGFHITISSTENPQCDDLRNQIADAEATIRDEAAILSDPNSTAAEKASAGRAIREERALIDQARQQAIRLGCRL